MEVTRELVQKTFPYGAIFIPVKDMNLMKQLSPFEFDEDEGGLVGTAWAHPNKSFDIDFSEATEEGSGWVVHDSDGEEGFIKPATEISWNKLKPSLDY